MNSIVLYTYPDNVFFLQKIRFVAKDSLAPAVRGKKNKLIKNKKSHTVHTVLANKATC